MNSRTLGKKNIKRRKRNSTPEENENSESEKSLNDGGGGDDDRNNQEKVEEQEEDSSSDYVISSDSEIDECPLFSKRKTNVLGLKRRRINKKPTIVQDDESITLILSKCCSFFLHSCYWTFLVIIICLVLIGFSCYFEFKWWNSYTIKELGKGMYYLNDSTAHPYKIEIPSDRVYIWHNEKIKRYTSRFPLFAQMMVQRAAKDRVEAKHKECHLYTLIYYKDKYHRPNDPPPKNATEEQVKSYLAACVLLGNMTTQSWDLEVKYRSHIEDILGVAF